MKFPASTSRDNSVSRLSNTADLFMGRFVLSTADPINFVDIVVVGSIVVTPVIAVLKQGRYVNLTGATQIQILKISTEGISIDLT